ncbi:MAG: winged helix-turn-helix transcriptional regulator [archaeon]|nr:winged helix-turn-helix transcriptional regulator [archaeon]
MDGKIRFTDILEDTGYSKSTINFILKNLANDGYIHIIGDGRARTYRAIVLRVLFIGDETHARREVTGEMVWNLAGNIEKHLLELSIGGLHSAGASIWPIISEMGKFMGPAAYSSLGLWTYENVMNSVKEFLKRAKIADLDVSFDDEIFNFTYTIDSSRSEAMAEMLSYFVKDFLMTYVSTMKGYRYNASAYSVQDRTYSLTLVGTDYVNPYQSRLDFKLEKVEGDPELPAIVGISTHIEVIDNMPMVRILRHLENNTLTVAEIAEELNIPAPTVFKYMSVMKSKGVITSDGRKYGELYWRDLPDIFPWSVPETQDYDFRAIAMRAWEDPEHFAEVAIDFIIVYLSAIGFDLGQFLSRSGKAIAHALHVFFPEKSITDIVGQLNSVPGNRLSFTISEGSPIVIDRISKTPLSPPVSKGLMLFYNGFFGMLLDDYCGRKAILKRSRLHGDSNSDHQMIFELEDIKTEEE